MPEGQFTFTDPDSDNDFDSNIISCSWPLKFESDSKQCEKQPFGFHPESKSEQYKLLYTSSNNMDIYEQPLLPTKKISHQALNSRPARRTELYAKICTVVSESASDNKPYNRQCCERQWIFQFPICLCFMFTMVSLGAEYLKVSRRLTFLILNKNVFQQNAYRPQQWPSRGVSTIHLPLRSRHPPGADTPQVQAPPAEQTPRG